MPNDSAKTPSGTTRSRPHLHALSYETESAKTAAVDSMLIPPLRVEPAGSDTSRANDVGLEKETENV